MWTFTGMLIAAAVLIFLLRFIVPEWSAAVIVGVLCVAGSVFLARDQRAKT